MFEFYLQNNEPIFTTLRTNYIYCKAKFFYQRSFHFFFSLLCCSVSNFVFISVKYYFSEYNNNLLISHYCNQTFSLQRQTITVTSVTIATNSPRIKKKSDTTKINNIVHYFHVILHLQEKNSGIRTMNFDV